MGEGSTVRVIETAQLSAAALASLRALMDAAFDGDFSEEDWQHALGGWHVLIGPDTDVQSHASVVPRAIRVGDREYRAGFVEAVATHPRRQRTGLGTTAMCAIDAVIREQFELGVLSSGEWGFYERLGWECWQGPSFVRLAGGPLARTAEDDDGVMVLRTPRTGPLDLAAPIECDERSGDSW